MEAVQIYNIFLKTRNVTLLENNNKELKRKLVHH